MYLESDDIHFKVEEEYLLAKETYKIIGACMTVHRELGPGFLEAVYQEALSIEFMDTKTPFEKEKPLQVMYKGKPLKKKYYADFVCYHKIIVEIKSIDGLLDNHLAQVLNYLKATDFKLGLLINFGTKSLQFKRIIL